MTNIQKFENHPNPLFRLPVNKIQEDEVFEVVKSSIARCYADTNTKILPEEENYYLINQLTDNILKNKELGIIRCEEIPIAFAKGIRNAYGEYYGLSVISFEKFIVGYLESDERRALGEERNRLMIEEKTDPTHDDKFKMAKQLCIEAFDKVKIKYSIGITAVTVFTFLNSLELIDSDYKKGIMKQATDLTITEKEKELSFCTEIFKRRKLYSDLEAFKSNLENDILTPAQYEEILKVGKRISLMNFLNDLILNEIDLSELIESKRDFYISSLAK